MKNAECSTSSSSEDESEMEIDFSKQRCLECGEFCQAMTCIEDFRRTDPEEYEDVYYCDKCDSGSPSWPAWHCNKCESDWCAPCALAANLDREYRQRVEKDSNVSTRAQKAKKLHLKYPLEKYDKAEMAAKPHFLTPLGRVIIMPGTKEDEEDEEKKPELKKKQKQSRNYRRGRKKKQNKTSKYTNVYFFSAKNKWCATITYNAIRYQLGFFDTEMEAAAAVNEKCRELGIPERNIVSSKKGRKSVKSELMRSMEPTHSKKLKPKIQKYVPPKKHIPSKKRKREYTYVNEDIPSSTKNRKFDNTDRKILPYIPSKDISKALPYIPPRKRSVHAYVPPKRSSIVPPDPVIQSYVPSQKSRREIPIDDRSNKKKLKKKRNVNDDKGWKGFVWDKFQKKTVCLGRFDKEVDANVAVNEKFREWGLALPNTRVEVSGSRWGHKIDKTVHMEIEEKPSRFIHEDKDSFFKDQETICQYHGCLQESANGRLYKSTMTDSLLCVACKRYEERTGFLTPRAQRNKGSRPKDMNGGNPGESTYVGVSKNSRENPGWKANIWDSNRQKSVYLGLFESQLDAAKAVNARCKLWGIPLKNPELEPDFPKRPVSKKKMKRKRNLGIEIPAKRPKRVPKPDIVTKNDSTSLNLPLGNSDDVNHNLESSGQIKPILNELKNDSVETDFVHLDSQRMRLEGPYASKEFWGSHYETQTRLSNLYDWFCFPQEAYKVFSRFLPKKETTKVLEMGCGNSPILKVLEDKRNFVDLTGADFCQTVITELQKTPGSKIKYEVQDAKSTTFLSETFDVIISKGLLDAIDCGRDCEVGADNFEEIVDVAEEMHRILKFRGIWIIITMCSINKRLEFLIDLESNYDRKFKLIKTLAIDSDIDKVNNCHCIILKKVHYQVY